MKRERGTEEEEERYGNYVCKETMCVWNTMVLYG